MSQIHFYLTPMRLVNAVNPAVTIPTRDNLAQCLVATEIAFQSTEFIHREHRCQLVEHRVVGAIALALVLSIDILILQCLAEGRDLLTQTLLGHHQLKIKTSF